MSLSETDTRRGKGHGGKQKEGHGASIQETKAHDRNKGCGEAGKEHQLFQELFQERDLVRVANEERSRTMSIKRAPFG